MIDIIRKRKIWYIFSSTLIVATFVGLAVRGVRYGIDFSGGTILEISYTKERPNSEDVTKAVNETNVGSLSLQAIGENGYLLRLPPITPEQKSDIMSKLREQIGQKDTGVQVTSGGGLIKPEDISVQFNDDSGKASNDGNQVVEDRFETIGPVIGNELKVRSIESLVLVIIAILLYVAWAFRKVSWPVKSWRYGLIAVLALFHDVIITFGIYIWVASFFGFEVDTAFVAAVLTVLGYSVNDTIVVFDRIRENLPRMSGSFEDVVSASVTQTMSRSLNTGLSTLLALIPIFFFGGETLKGFIFALIVGIFFGTYSSVCIASPLLVTMYQRQQMKKK